jgi:hypothetical protein
VEDPDSLHQKKNIPNKIISSDSGQSTIEFLTTFSVVLTFLFVFVRVALSFTNGYMVHYATFMASRTYYTYDDNSNEPAGIDSRAFTKARETFGKIISANGIELEQHSPESGNNKTFVGVIAKFRQKFSSSNVIGGNELIDFVSESFLGRTPMNGECAEMTCEGIKNALGTSSCELKDHTTVFDNGC